MSRLPAGCFEEALRKGGSGPTPVIEAVGFHDGAELIPAEDAEKGRDAKLARVEEGADRILFLR